MWRLTLLVLTAFVSIALLAPTTAGDLPRVTPEEVGLSSAKLERIDAAMQRYVDDEKLVGITTMVIRRGRIAHIGTYGQMDREAGKAMRRDAILRFYSMTKPITTAALMTLYEEGRFQLDDPASKYFPQFKDLKVYAGEKDGKPELVEPHRAMTVRDLMRHTSGLTYGIFGATAVDRMYREANMLDRSSNLEQMVTKLGGLPLLFHPGERWNYSVSVDVQGRLIEVLSGKSLDEFFRERIFEPLEMHDTGFHVPAEKVDRFTANYGPKSGGGLRVIDAPGGSNYTSPPGLFSGGGGLVSTADDYLRFAQMLLNRGQLEGTRILKPETVDLMTQNHLAEELIPIRLSIITLANTGFGLGVSVRVDRNEDEPAGAIGEYGWAGAASTFFFVVPKEQLIGLALAQYMPLSTAFSQEFRSLAYDAILEPAGGE